MTLQQGNWLSVTYYIIQSKTFPTLIRKAFLCNCMAAGQKTSNERTSAQVETCLTHARRGQHTHSKQKLLYLSNIKTYIITRTLCNNTGNLSQQSWQNSQVNTVYSSKRLDDNNTQPQPSSCLWWSQSVCYFDVHTTSAALRLKLLLPAAERPQAWNRLPQSAEDKLNSKHKRGCCYNSSISNQELLIQRNTTKSGCKNLSVLCLSVL